MKPILMSGALMGRPAVPTSSAIEPQAVIAAGTFSSSWLRAVSVREAVTLPQLRMNPAPTQISTNHAASAGDVNELPAAGKVAIPRNTHDVAKNHSLSELAAGSVPEQSKADAIPVPTIPSVRSSFASLPSEAIETVQGDSRRLISSMPVSIHEGEKIVAGDESVSLIATPMPKPPVADVRASIGDSHVPAAALITSAIARPDAERYVVSGTNVIADVPRSSVAIGSKGKDVPSSPKSPYSGTRLVPGPPASPVTTLSEPSAAPISLAPGPRTDVSQWVHAQPVLPIAAARQHDDSPTRLHPRPKMSPVQSSSVASMPPVTVLPQTTGNAASVPPHPRTAVVLIDQDKLQNNSPELILDKPQVTMGDSSRHDVTPVGSTAPLRNHTPITSVGGAVEAKRKLQTATTATSVLVGGDGHNAAPDGVNVLVAVTDPIAPHLVQPTNFGKARASARSANVSNKPLGMRLSTKENVSQNSVPATEAATAHNVHKADEVPVKTLAGNPNPTHAEGVALTPNELATQSHGAFVPLAGAPVRDGSLVSVHTAPHAVGGAQVALPAISVPVQNPQSFVQPQTVSVAPGRLEVGVLHGTHGWLRVRAELGPEGSINTSVTTLDNAHDALKSAIPEIANYLSVEAVKVDKISIHRFAETQVGLNSDASGGQAGGNAQSNESGESLGRSSAQSAGAMDREGDDRSEVGFDKSAGSTARQMWKQPDIPLSTAWSGGSSGVGTWLDVRA